MSSHMVIMIAVASGVFGGILGAYLVLCHVTIRMNREAKKWNDLRITVKLPEGGLVTQ